MVGPSVCRRRGQFPAVIHVYTDWADHLIVTSLTAGRIVETQSLTLEASELHERMLPLLRGEVFHVTTIAAAAGAATEGSIRANSDGEFPFPFAQSANSYFRRRGCVSVFDLRDVADEQLNETLEKYYFLNPSFTSNRPVFFLLSSIFHQRLIPWTEWRASRDFGQMIIPYVEAGFPDSIPLAAVARVVHLEVVGADVEPLPGTWLHQLWLADQADAD
jgi:hypothetical protein